MPLVPLTCNVLNAAAAAGEERETASGAVNLKNIQSGLRQRDEARLRQERGIKVTQ